MTGTVTVAVTMITIKSINKVRRFLYDGVDLSSITSIIKFRSKMFLSLLTSVAKINSSLYRELSCEDSTEIFSDSDDEYSLYY